MAASKRRPRLHATPVSSRLPMTPGCMAASIKSDILGTAKRTLARWIRRFQPHVVAGQHAPAASFFSPSYGASADKCLVRPQSWPLETTENSRFSCEGETRNEYPVRLTRGQRDRSAQIWAVLTLCKLGCVRRRRDCDDSRQFD